MELDSIPQQTQEMVEQIDSADLVVGILADLDQDGVATLCEGLRTLPGSLRIVVLQSDPVGKASAADSQAAEENASLSLLPWSVFGPDPLGAPLERMSIACQSLFAASDKLGARACCVVASKMEIATARWVCQLVQPLLDTDVDLVVPYYASGKLQGLLNSSVVYPLTRCLYGKRIRNPLGPDVGVSRRLAQKILGANRQPKAAPNGTHPLAALAPVAICDNLQVCQVHVGARLYPPIDWMNMSSLVAQVLGPVFVEMDKNAACWQRTRGSVSVMERGELLSLPQETETLDIDRMVETFQLGVRDLREIWSLVLPPATLFELGKLSRLTQERVHMPDELWARIVYDFALAHRLRTINRDHLLHSMTPLYLAWIVSYARELETAGAAIIEQRIERLSLAYEATKPYLVSRWRWPDRFNP